MTTRRYNIGWNRREQMILPPCLDDYVSAANLVRAIDAYVEGCDLAGRDFANAQPVRNGAGQPAFDPSDLLELYLYGHLHRVRSSRLLEAEARRNPQGAYRGFASEEELWKTLTLKRWEILKTMTGAGPMSLREAALRVGRDVKGVSGDVHKLLDAGLLDKTAEGKIVFPFDAVHVDFMLKAA